MSPLEEKPFRSEDEEKEPAEVHIRIGHPRVRPHVVVASGREGHAPEDFVTSFLVAWQPSPTPPAHWIELLKSAPFGTQAIRARDLHWDGRSFSIKAMRMCVSPYSPNPIPGDTATLASTRIFFANSSEPMDL